MPAVILAALLLSGCNMYVAAEHKSDPHIENDGLDVLCAGFEHEGQLEVKAGYCKDVRQGDGLYELRVEYDWRIIE